MFNDSRPSRIQQATKAQTEARRRERRKRVSVSKKYVLFFCILILSFIKAEKSVFGLQRKRINGMV